MWLVRLLWLFLALAGWWYSSAVIASFSTFQSLPWGWKAGLYFAAYTLLGGLAVPGVILLTPLAGTLFGMFAGTLLASISSTVGACLSFLSSRHLLGGDARSQRGTDAPTISLPAKIGARELFILRLIPAFPYFAINLVAGRGQLSFTKYWLVSQIGMLPSTFLLVRAGNELSDNSVVSISSVLSALWPVIILCIVAMIARRKITTRSTLSVDEPS